jgi:hypothetical protein
MISFKYLDRSKWLFHGTLDNNTCLNTLKSQIPRRKKYHSFNVNSDQLLKWVLDKKVLPYENNRGISTKYINTSNKTVKSVCDNLNPSVFNTVHIVYISKNKQYYIADGHARTQGLIKHYHTRSSKLINKFKITLTLHCVNDMSDFLLIYAEVNKNTVHNVGHVVDNPDLEFGSITHNLLQNIPSEILLASGRKKRKTLLSNYIYTLKHGNNKFDFPTAFYNRGDSRKEFGNIITGKFTLSTEEEDVFNKGLIVYNKIMQVLQNKVKELKETKDPIYNDITTKLSGVINSVPIMGLILSDIMFFGGNIVGRRPKCCANRIMSNLSKICISANNCTNGSKENIETRYEELRKLIKSK